MSDEIEEGVEPRGIGRYRDQIISGPIIRTLLPISPMSFHYALFDAEKISGKDPFILMYGA
ncbi:MAG: hypothetical protein NDF51_06085 [archaeon YNP-WB-040]|jgi:hypothetical protein|nr:hypothetical protein [Candidatus Culexarchaeum yellowstonense]